VILVSRCHCEDDTQASSPSGYTENEQANFMNVRLQSEVRNSLFIQARNISCFYLSRGSLDKRIQSINEVDQNVGVHVAIEPHFNALPGIPQQRGFYAICWKGSERGLLLAEKIVARLEAVHPGPNLGVCQVYKDKRWIDNDEKEWDGAPELAFIQNTTCPAVIVELGYYTNYEEGLWLEKLTNRYELAVAMAHGITDYLKEVID
jgi:N-acetylmuramoyl-L-alanine amidase